MPDFPGFIKVGPLIYKVHRDKARMADIRNECGEGHRVAQVAFQKLEIDVDPALAPGRQALSLLHEIIHACMQITYRSDDKLDDEQIAAGLDAPLLGVLRDNPQVVEYLTEIPGA